jgi:hypothetical protein
MDAGQLNSEFLNRAMVRTSFNLIAKDFESLTYKKEIQHLFNLHFFPKFNNRNDIHIDRITAPALKKAIKTVQNIDARSFEALYKYNLKGVGPGEVMLYFILNNGHLGGGSSAGVDIVDAAGSFEVKAVDYSANGKYVNNFKIGGTFSIAEIMRGIQGLKKDAGLGSGSEVNSGHLATIRKQFPAQLKALEDKFIDLSYNNYFKNHKIIFLANKTGGGFSLGDLIAIKQVQKKDIILERITSGTIKPRVKM